MSGDRYQEWTGNATLILLCSDCGSPVATASRAAHDAWHERVERPASSVLDADAAALVREVVRSYVESMLPDLSESVIAVLARAGYATQRPTPRGPNPMRG